MSVARYTLSSATVTVGVQVSYEGRHSGGVMGKVSRGRCHKKGVTVSMSQGECYSGGVTKKVPRGGRHRAGVTGRASLGKRHREDVTGKASLRRLAFLHVACPPKQEDFPGTRHQVQAPVSRLEPESGQR